MYLDRCMRGEGRNACDQYLENYWMYSDDILQVDGMLNPNICYTNKFPMQPSDKSDRV